jgi:hypothetical protein
MRIQILVIASLFLLAFFAVESYSVDWSNPESQSVDQMIAGPDQGVVIPNTGPVETPQSSRAAQIGQPGKDILSIPTGNGLSSGATDPKQARSQDTNKTVTLQQADTNSTIPIQPKISPEPTAVSGSWSLELNDSASHMAILTLFQNGNDVYGSGNLNLDANTTMMAAASGTVIGDKLNLDMVSLGRVSLYRISMTVIGDSAAGSYAAFRPGSVSTTGTANGLRSVPAP